MEAPAGNGSSPSTETSQGGTRRRLNALTGGAALVTVGIALTVVGVATDTETPATTSPPPPTTTSSRPPPTAGALAPMWQAVDVLEDAYGEGVNRQNLAGAALASLAEVSGESLEALSRDEPVPDEVAAGFEEVWQLWHHIEQSGSEIDSRDLMVRAMRAMVATTDDPGAAIVVDASVAPDGYVEDAYHGIGAFVAPVEDFIVIGQPFPGGPASDAGLRPGDLLLEVDGVSVVGMPIDEVVALVRGPVGTTVSLLLERAGTDPVEVDVVREELELATARFSMHPGEIGYLSISSFESRTPGEVQTELERLMLRDTRALILDLRRNQGGSPSAAMAVADQFLDGDIVYLEEGLDGTSTAHHAQAGGLATELPLAILIDQSTAGEAELVAAALRYHRRGPLFGLPSSGRAALHQGREIGDGVILVTRSGWWLTPSRESVDQRGLPPDQVVELTPDDVAGGFDRQQATANAYLWSLLEGDIPDDGRDAGGE